MNTSIFLRVAKNLKPNIDSGNFQYIPFFEKSWVIIY